MQGQSFDSLNLGVGGSVGWDITQPSTGAHVKPSVHAGYAWNAINDNIDSQASFVGSNTAFQTFGVKPGRSRVTGGLGVVYVSTVSWELSGNYDYTWKPEYLSRTAVARATVKF